MDSRQLAIEHTKPPAGQVHCGSEQMELGDAKVAEEHDTRVVLLPLSEVEHAVARERDAQQQPRVSAELEHRGHRERHELHRASRPASDASVMKEAE